MTWKTKLLFMLILAIPAFIGWPVTAFGKEIIAGVRLSWVLYALVVHGTILLVAGAGFAEKALTLAVLISTPVVFLGAGISFLLLPDSIDAVNGAATYSAHYVSLCLTMLTVIPLTICMVALIPFHRFEHTLLEKTDGVSKVEKFTLMFLRVFNHIVYSVIPGILEVIQEERHYRAWFDRQVREHHSLVATIRYRQKWFAALLKDMIQIGVEGICASIQYIPLWAIEISQLPSRRDFTK